MGERRVIVDASVLILYARAGRLDLLEGVFDRLLLPLPVREEVFTKGPQRPDVRAVEAAVQEGWVVPASVSGTMIGRVSERFPALGLGECACLALARSSGAPIVLFDDATARKAAKMLGLRPVGSLGVIARAYRAGVLKDQDEVARMVRALISAGLWITADVIEAFWDGIGGR